MRSRTIVSVFCIVLLLITQVQPSAESVVDKLSRDNSTESSEISISNENLIVYVEDSGSEIGTFTLETADGNDLLYTERNHESWSSYLTVQVGGGNYVTGDIASRGSPTFMHNYVTKSPTIVDNSIVTEWELPVGIKVIQTVRLVGEAAEFRVKVKNIGSQARNIRVRYLFDYQVKKQDGAPIAVKGQIITHEREFKDPTFDSWFTYDNIPPTLKGKATLSTAPYMIIFANWASAKDYPFTYGDFNETRRFYTPGEIYSPESDSSALIYWDLGSVNPGDTSKVTTFYGVGPPGMYRGVKNSLERYQSAVNCFIEKYTEAKAEANAKLYKKYGDNFSEDLISYFSYKAGIGSGENLPKNLKQIWDNIAKDMSRENALAIYQFLKEMFDKVTQDNTLEEIENVFYKYYNGTWSTQENFLLFNGLTLENLKENFNSNFDLKENEIMESLDEENVSQEDASLLARYIRGHAEELEHRTIIEETNYQNFASIFLEGENVEALTFSIGIEASPQISEVAFIAFATIAIETVIDTHFLTQAFHGIISSASSVIFPPPPPPKSKIPNFEEAIKTGWFDKLVEQLKAIDKINNVKKLIKRIQDIKKELIGKDGEIISLRVEDITSEDLISPNNSEAPIGKGNGTVIIKNTGDVSLITNPVLFKPYLFGEIYTLPPGEDTLLEKVPSGVVAFPDLPSAEGQKVQAPNLKPGEEAEINFEYAVPVDYFSCEDYLILIFFNPNMYIRSKLGAATFKAYDNLDACELTSSEVVSEGTVAEGEISETTHSPKENTDRVTYTLSYSGSDLDLHLYDENGNHVGMNYQTGEFENQIPDAVFSGPDGGVRRSEWIRVRGVSSVYRIKVVPLETGVAGASYSVVSSEVPELPPVLQLLPDGINIEALLGREKTANLTVRELGGYENLTSVNLKATDLIGPEGENISAQNLHFDKEKFDVGPGDFTQVQLNIDLPSDINEGTYVGSVVASADNTEDESGINVKVTDPTVVENLSISKKSIKPGEFTTISVEVTNTGDGKVTKTVKLSVNGEVVKSKTVELDPGQTEEVTFSLLMEEVGTYRVSVGRLTDSFEVKKPLPTTIIGGVIAVIVVIIGAVVYFRRRR